jgi:TRAP-type transport system periplasmic protein
VRKSHYGRAARDLLIGRAYCCDEFRTGFIDPDLREDDMRFVVSGKSMRGGAAATAVTIALALGAARAQDHTPNKTYVMKLTTATINDAPHQYIKDFAATVQRDSGGRIKAEVYPASQLGSIPRQIEGVQFGSIEGVAMPPEFMVGVDERFEVMAAPGLVDSFEHGQRIAADPAVQKLMLELGAAKGLHGVGIALSQPSAVISKTPLRHLADFQGKKIRIFASQFQTVAFNRLGATPVAMSLGDVLPALQQGTIDGAAAGIGPFVHLHFGDAAKYVTETNQPAIFLMLEVSQKWYDSLPKDLQEIVDRDGAAVSTALNPAALAMYAEQRTAWLNGGGELISLPRDEQSAMMATLASVGADVAKTRPAVRDAYQVVTDAAQRARQVSSR